MWEAGEGAGKRCRCQVSVCCHTHPRVTFMLHVHLFFAITDVLAVGKAGHISGKTSQIS